MGVYGPKTTWTHGRRNAGLRYTDLEQRIEALEQRITAVESDQERELTEDCTRAFAQTLEREEAQEANEEPLPCPVCGWRCDVMEDSCGADNWVKCSHCRAGGPHSTCRDWAVSKWNALCRDVERGRRQGSAETDLTAVYLKGVEDGKDKMRKERDHLAEIVRDVAQNGGQLRFRDAIKRAREWVEAQGRE